MKKIILCLAVLLLLFANCQKPCKDECSCDKETSEEHAPCKIKYPKDIKPIDWNNYNDAYTVHWNFYTYYSKIKEEDEHREIMIYGWIPGHYDISADMFYLYTDENSSNLSKGTSVTIRAMGWYVNQNIAPQVQTKLDTSDLTKKCFVKGRLRLFQEPCCGWILPEIWITNSDDVYFE